VKYPVKVYMNPGLTRAASGQTYIIAGCMIPVPSDTTWDDMSKYVTYVKSEYDIKSWKVTSSSGSTYTVSRINSDKLTCTCPGFKFRQKCKHTDKVSNESR